MSQLLAETKYSQAVFLTAVVTACVFAISTPEATAVERPGKVAEAAGLQAQMRADVEYLASEELRGRDSAEPSIQVAADYIVDRMKSLGMTTDAVGGEPFQSVNVELGAQPGTPEHNLATFSFASDDKDTINAQLSEDMNPLSIGAVKGEASGSVAFVGFGITAPKLKYDDYAGIDTKGKVVIVLRKEPGAADPRSPFDGVRNTRHAYFATKIENAVKHGAAAVMIVNDKKSIDEATKITRYKISQEEQRRERIQDQIKKLPKEAKNSLNTFRMQLDAVNASIESMNLELERSQRGLLGISAAGSATKEQIDIPVVSISRNLVDQLLQDSKGESLDEIESAINDTIRPRSHAFDELTCSLEVQLKPTSADSPNVIGFIEGKGDLAKESVIIGAHYDHVGMGGYGSLAPGTVAIHNGADDNASGVASMLAAARQVKEGLAGHESHRRVVLIAFTGEERGLIGSKYYVKHPVFPLETTAAMINLDMVGRLRDNELTIYGTGSADALDEIVENANESRAFELFKITTGYGPSDHQSFYKAGVPVLFFFTGLHNDYHRPSDDSDKIDFGGMTRITDMVSDVTLRLATRSERPKYAETENKVQIRRQLTAYLGVTLSDRGDHVVISSVSAKSPAQQGGLQPGDQFSRLGKRRIRTSTDVFELLRNRKPGDTITVQVLRQGNLLDVKVKLGKRPTG